MRYSLRTCNNLWYHSVKNYLKNTSNGDNYFRSLDSFVLFTSVSCVLSNLADFIAMYTSTKPDDHLENALF